MTDRTAGRIVGILFIVASAAAIVGGALLLPIDDALADVADKEAQIVTGVLIELILVLAVVGIGTLIFPILKRQGPGNALAYAGSRMLEAVLLLAASVSALVVLGLAQGDAGDAGPLHGTLVDTREWTYLLGSMVLLGVSALILNTVLYRGRLVPGWLAIWGIVGGVLILVRGIIEAYGTEFSGAMQAVFAGPIAIQEMVLAVLLIARGFNVGDPRTG